MVYASPLLSLCIQPPAWYAGPIYFRYAGPTPFWYARHIPFRYAGPIRFPVRRTYLFPVRRTWSSPQPPPISMTKKKTSEVPAKAFGKDLTASMGLPESTFPPDKSWAFSPHCTSVEDKQVLATSTYHGPTATTNKSIFDPKTRDSSDEGSLAQDFLDLNARAIRGRSEARCNTRSEQYGIIHRQPIGGALLYAKI